MSLRLLAALGILLLFGIVIVGSLVPYEPIPGEPFQLRLLQISAGPGLFSGAEHISKSDVLANILLFFPTGILLVVMAAQCSRFSFQLGVVAVGSAVAMLVSYSVESIQLSSVNRTASWLDVYAHLFGLTSGIAVSLVCSRFVLRWFEKRNKEQTGDAAVALMVTYLLGFTFLTLLPFDIALSPSEIYHKWKDGGIGITDASSLVLVRNILMNVISAIPIGILFGYACNSGRRAIVYSSLLVLGIELCQVLVISRVASLSDALALVLGATIGCLGTLAARKRADQISLPTDARFWWLASCLAGTYIVLALSFTNEPLLSWQEARVRADGLVDFSLESVLIGDSLARLTNVFEKIAIWISFGTFVGFASKTAYVGRGTRLALAGAICLICAILVESFQVFTANHYPSGLDIVLYMTGAGMGIGLSELTMYRNQFQETTENAPQSS